MAARPTRLSALAGAAGAVASRAAGGEIVHEVAVHTSGIEVHGQADVPVCPRASGLGGHGLDGVGVGRRRQGVDAEEARKEQCELQYGLMGGSDSQHSRCA